MVMLRISSRRADAEGARFRRHPKGLGRIEGISALRLFDDGHPIAVLIAP
jgi:hypothetical protein